MTEVLEKTAENITTGKNGQHSTLKCINPGTKEVITTIPVDSSDDINNKLQKIRGGLEQWQSLSLKERARYITDVRRKMVERMDELIDVICSETGKTRFDGQSEIMTTAEIMRFVSKKGPKILADESRNPSLLKTKKGYVRYLPSGIVGIISPWNYPLILAAGPVFQALISGNGVILKPSEYTPLTALKLKEISDASGFPPDIFQVAIGTGEVGQQIVGSPETDMICFTGSVGVGRKIAVACAEKLKPVILEMGGKDPMYVADDADLDRAANAAVWGGFSNAGQTCIAIERVYVDEKVADDFIEKVTALTENITYGPNGSTCDMGSLSTEMQKDIVLSHIRDAVEKGAKVLTGGELDESLNGYFIKPTVLVDVDETMDIMTKETFGPEISIIKVKNDQEALEKMNSLSYGLNASIFTSDKRRARMMSRKIRAGNICINDVLSNYLCVELPFGGMGISGIGRMQGEEGIKAFAQIQSVCEDRFGMKKELWWFPSSSRIKRLFKSLIKLRYG